MIKEKKITQNNLCQITKISKKYGKVGDFLCDIKKLDEKENKELIKKGTIIFNNNLLRNVYAHKMRLPWWKNEKFSKNDFFLKKDMYKILKNGKDEKQEIIKIIKDTKKYEEEIEKSNNKDELESATEILREIHDSLSGFLNLSFGVMNSKLFL